jgi:transposase InsO family protein
MVVGWQLATHLRTELALDALQMAIWRRHRHAADLSGLVHHSDRGVQHLAEIRGGSTHATPSPNASKTRATGRRLS